MTGPEGIDWIVLQRAGQRLTRELEPLPRAWPRLLYDIEQVSQTFAAARDKWRPLFEELRRLSRAFVAARDRGDFRNFQIRLRLTGWMLQWIEWAKDNPSDRRARAWLTVGHLTPKQIAELLPYMIMDTPELRVPKRRGRQKGRIAPSKLKMVEQMDERIKRTGELPTTAARRLLADFGFCGQDVKGRADALVRVWKNRALK